MKKIKLFLSLMLLAVSTVAFAQNITVKGTVKDASNGETVPFASVQLKGTTSGVVTDADGVYSISAPTNAVLVFSSVGYKTVEVAVAGKALHDVSLETDSEFIDETIVVAYGTATKSSFTGSAAMVKTEDIEKKIATNVTSALSGTTPGVQIMQSSGDPTSNGTTIRVRGIGSMSASNSPLIVLDGVPYEGSISDINPNDVESMSVLKDAAASAIYGHRGANGVVLITTKKGASGDAQVKFDARFGSNSRLIPQYDVITDPAQYYETYYTRMYNSYYYAGHTEAQSYAYADKNLFDQNNGGLGYQVYTIPAGEKFIGTNFKLNPNAKLGYSDGEYYYTPDNWYDEVFHNSFRQEYNLSVSGSSNRFNYYASAGFLDDGGIIENSGYKRYTGRVNAEYQVKSWFRLISNMSYSHTASGNVSSGSWGSSGNPFYAANNIGPIYPLYVRNADGSIKTDSAGHVVYDTSGNSNFIRPNLVGNAIRDNMYDKETDYADVLTAKGGVVLTPIKNMTLTANIGITSDNTRSSSLGSIFGSSAATDGYVYVGSGRMFTVNQQYLAQYKTDFAGTNHHLDVMAGYEQYNRTSQSLSGSNTNLFNPLVGELSNADGTTNKTVSSSSNYYMTEGYLARVQYDYDGRYFLSGSYRRDASSRFAKGHRWGNFWSLGGAWLMSSESFLESASWLDMLKFKASYGQQGNDNIGGLYPYSDQYSHSYNEATGEYSISLTYKGNEDLTWETSKSFNVGFDFEIKRGLLNGTVEWFSRKTEDLLYSKAVPYSAGNPTGAYPVNVGNISNTGFEISLDGNIINTRNIQWTWNINASHYKNKILKLDDSVSENGIKGSYYIYKEGGSLYDAYMYKWAGVDHETGQALYWAHVDATDDAEAYDYTTTNFGKATRYELGSILPKLYGGFGSTLNAYGFDFSFQFAYQLGGKFYDSSYQNYMWTQDEAGMAWHKDILKAWTPENKDSNIPRNDGDTQVSQSSVDRFLTTSNYLSLNNVTLGYTVPKKFTSKISIAALRVYVAAENAMLLTSRKGLDPRQGMGLQSFSSGNGSSSYAAMRTVTGGVTLTF